MKITMKLNRIYEIGSTFGGTRFGVTYTAKHIGRDWFQYFDSHGVGVRISGDRLEEIFEIIEHD